jgi:hypothetical protein
MWMSPGGSFTSGVSGWVSNAEQRLAQAHADAVAEVFTDLPDEQLDQLTALLDRLRAAMRDRLA